MILFGTGKSKIREEYHNDITCNNCNTTCQHRITIKGIYFDIFFIPIFPITRSTYSECEHCRIQLEEKDWSEKLKTKFHNNLRLNPAKRPIWHYLGCLTILAIIAFMGLLTVYALIFNKEENSNENTNIAIEEEYNFEDENSDTTSIMVKEFIPENTVIEEETEIEESEPTDSITSFF